MNENTVARENLEVGKLYWLFDTSDYMNHHAPELVRVESVEPDLYWKGQLVVKVKKVLTAETCTVSPIYTEFQSIHPSWLNNKKLAIQQQIELLRHELAIYESLG